MASMAAPAPPEARAGSPPGTFFNFMGLPQEVQREIIEYCSMHDLICVALVSRHFRDLAAAELYHTFLVVFPDEDNLQFDTSVDALARGLDTFVTSDYNYAQYLKALCFDTFYMGDKAEGSYRPYLANLSCGKFMNTLLHLTLRKARSLEIFKWNIRVELSRPVYKELHQLESLSEVHIRLQAGPSQYETPPPLPYNASQLASLLGPAHATPISSLPPPPPAFAFIPPPPPGGFYVPTSSVPLPPLPKPHRARTPKKASVENQPPTLSGFKNLRSLSVHDMESLDIVPELQACLRNCAGTLTNLKLSFSEKLAASARKPSIDPEPEDSDQEDEMVPLPHSHAHNEEMSGPARAFRAQEERKTQETVLGRIFDIEPTPPQNVQIVRVDKKETKGKVKSEQELVDCMKTIAAKVMGELNGTNDCAPSQDVIDMISLAAKKYIDEVKSEKAKQDEPPKPSDPSSSSSSQPADETAAEAPTESLFSETAPAKAKDDQRGASPDDIDIEEPEEQLVIDPEEPPASDTPVNEPASTPSEVPEAAAAVLASTRTEYGKALATLEAQKADYKLLAEELEIFESQANTLTQEIRRWRASNSSVDLKNLSEAESRLLSFTRSVRDMQKEINACQATIECAETLPSGQRGPSKERANVQNMRDYVRETRGIALETLGIYLIPVKASVLSRAVDLRALRHIVLLNVGIQAPIWALMHRENREAPLPLCKIFTDNVSLVFLNFVASLQKVDELLLLEREVKAKPESFAPRTQTTMDQIRRLVLKKHLPTLTRLMIKNSADTTWDIDEKTVLLLCKQGKKITELACNMSIRAMHCLMQHIAGLASLRALHVVHLRNDDTCVWVMRETKKFLIDNVSHYPDLKLEYIAIDEDDRVDQLVRVVSTKKENADGGGGDDGDGAEGGKGKDKDKKKDGKSKGKQKATTTNSSSGIPSLDAGSSSAAAADLDVTALIAAELGDEGSSSGSEEDSDDDEDDEFLGQKIKTVEGLFFCEVEGIAIFQKEIVAGRL